MRIKKIIAAILALTMFCTTVAFAVTETDGTFGDELTPEQYDFIYNEGNYEKSFLFNTVVVVLKKGIPFQTVDFSGIDIAKIYIISSAYFEQTERENELLFLRLNGSEKESVLTAIEALKDNPCVLYAEPYYAVYTPGAAGDPSIVDTIIGATTNSGSRGYGDINYDGQVNNADLIILAKYIVRLTNLTYNQLRFADINGDNSINNTDLVLLARKVVGIF